MNDSHTVVAVTSSPPCDFCPRLAEYDGKTRRGPWAYMCEEHFHALGIGLGLGRGQRLITIKE